MQLHMASLLVKKYFLWNNDLCYSAWLSDYLQVKHSVGAEAY